MRRFMGIGLQVLVGALALTVGCATIERRHQLTITGTVPACIGEGTPVFLALPDGSVIGEGRVHGRAFSIDAVLRSEATVSGLDHRLVALKPSALQVVAEGLTCTAATQLEISDYGPVEYGTVFLDTYLRPVDSRVEIVKSDKAERLIQKLTAFNERQMRAGLPPLAVMPANLDVLDRLGCREPPPLVPTGRYGARWELPGLFGDGPNLDFLVLRIERDNVTIGGMPQPWKPPYEVLIAWGLAVVRRGREVRWINLLAGSPDSF